MLEPSKVAGLQELDNRLGRVAGVGELASGDGLLLLNRRLVGCVVAQERNVAVIVGLSEGLQGSALNAGNFQAAIRLTADKTIRPLWRMAAASLSTLVPAPGSGSRLFYDDRDVAFLRDNTTDEAAIQEKQAITARQLTDAGYTPESVVQFLQTGDLARLKHSGLFSVQLQAPGSTTALPSPEGDS